MSDHWVPPSDRNLGQMKFLPTEDLKEALAASHKAELFVAGYYDFDRQHLLLFRGNGMSLVVPASVFVPNAKHTPDFTKFDIIDCGQTVSLGDYEASSRSILRAMDPEYDRKCEAENEVWLRKRTKISN